MPRTTKLEFHPREMVLKVLQAVKQPLAAYDILEKLKENGVKSPQIIYRALQDLELKGLVHRLGTINAFIACNEGCNHKTLALITICSHCKIAEEMNNSNLASQFHTLSESGLRFKEKSVIELPIVCDACD